MDPSSPPPPCSLNSGNVDWPFIPMIANIGENPAPGTAYLALESICHSLNFSSEESLEFFPVALTVYFTVDVLRCNISSEECLLAARSIAYLCDELPDSTEMVVTCGAIPALCAQLIAVDYLELAEECVKALEMISRTEPSACLQEQTLIAALNIINFFPINTQRTVLDMIYNTCECVTEQDASLVISVMAILCTMLAHQDQEVASTAAASMVEFAMSFRLSSYFFDELCKCGVIRITLDVISLDSLLALDKKGKQDLIKMLTISSSRSLEVIKILYNPNFNSTFAKLFLQILTNAETDYEQACALINFFNAIIPSFEKDGQYIQLLLEKENILRGETKFLLQLARDILPVLVQIVKSGANMSIIYGCVTIANNVIYLTTSKMLRELVKEINISKFLGHLLTFKNKHVLVPALIIVKNLILKLPGHFLNSFVMEGVADAVYALPLDCSEYVDRSKEQSGETLAGGKTAKCFCYTFDSFGLALESCKIGESMLVTLVKQIKADHFSEEIISKVASNKALQELKVCCTNLKNYVDSFPTTENNATIEIEKLEQVMLALMKMDSMSVYSFIGSGILSTLVHFLSNGKLLHGSYSYNDVDKFAILERRFYIFSYLCILKLNKNGKSSFQKIFLRYLQDMLSSLDLFPIIKSQSYKARLKNTDIPVGRQTLSPFLRVCFVSEAQVGLNNNENVLAVGISSSFEEIEQFLWTKDFPKIPLCSSLQGIEGQDGNRAVPTAQRVQDNQPKLTFFMDGVEIDRSLTLYQTIVLLKLNSATDNDGHVVGPKFWEKVYMVTYTRSNDCSNSSSNVGKKAYFPIKLGIINIFKIMQSSRIFLDKISPNEAILVRDILFMLKILESMNHMSCEILHIIRRKAFAMGRLRMIDEFKVTPSSFSLHEFVNSKLTDKLQKQLQDNLVSRTGAMPSWCSKLMDSFPFLFSFKVKCKYFHLSTLQSVEEIQMPENPPIRFIVNRKNILASAEMIMSKCLSIKSSIVFEFDGEIGIGSGPTVEFFTLVSHEFQKLGIGMWREGTRAYAELNRESAYSELVTTSTGLFPRPFSEEARFSKEFSEVRKKFVLLGKFIAWAIKEQRILDLPLSQALYKLILDQELNTCDIHSFDPELGRTLMEFEAIISRKQYLANAQKSWDQSCLYFRNSKIEDLCLDFSLPGYPDYILPSGRIHEVVNIDNLEVYVSQVVDATVRSGIAQQIEDLKFGFNQVFPIKSLQIFNEECDQLICGETTQWNFNELRMHICFLHGYTLESFEAINFLEILQELNHVQRKAFLQFVTSSTRLPRGGLASLVPKLTIVRKHCTNEVDMELPSVMTCVNYLKLPPYSSKEIMRRKILYAISEGLGAFLLS